MPDTTVKTGDRVSVNWGGEEITGTVFRVYDSPSGQRMVLRLDDTDEALALPVSYATVMEPPQWNSAHANVYAKAVVDMGLLALRFGRVDRITYHEDGVTPESDSDHTVMLGLIACAFAAEFLPRLDLGRIAQYALVHDVVEAYAGDTPTLQISEAEQASKEEREAAAQARIEAQFGDTLPWLPGMIRSYEERKVPEARYVKAMDKLVPKVTHILNDLTTVRAQGMDRAALQARYDRQFHELGDYAVDFPPLFALRRELVDMCMARFGRAERTACGVCGGPYDEETDSLGACKHCIGPAMAGEAP